MQTNHAHVEAAAFSILAVLLLYGIRWIFGFKIPAVIFKFPAFLVIFLGFYILCYIFFWIAWNKK